MGRKSKSSAARRGAGKQLPADDLANEGTRFVHERVYRRIRQLIVSGAVTKGDRLPSSRILAENLRISRNSVLTALDRLIADGWLESRRGSGVYVTYRGPPVAEDSHSPEAEQQSRIPFALGWASDFQIFPVQLWNRLQTRRWRSMPEHVLQQQDRNGVPELRKSIAAHAALLRSLECAPAQVFVASSIPAAIELALHALGLIGSEFWVEEPCCQSPLNALLRSRVRVVPVPVDARGIDVERGIASAPDAAAALVTAACQAPTGVALDGKRRSRLAEWAKSAGAWIFEDDFNWNGDGRSLSVPPYATQHRDQTIYFNSFNNILFPGLRVAYLISPPELIDAFAAVRGSEGEVNTANQFVLADFIEEGHLDLHLRRLNACNAERRAALLECVEVELSEFLSPRHSAGGYFICGSRKFSEIDLLAAAEAHNIAVTGMSSFRLTPPPNHEVVLGFSQFEPKTLRNAAIRLRRALRSASP